MELHLEIITSNHTKFAVEVDLKLPKVPYKETIRGTAKVEGKHKKQSGGRGQYGHVFIEFSPLPTGEGFEFEDKILVSRVGNIPLGKGAAGSHGIRVRPGSLPDIASLYDGSYHSVDSSEMAFKIAASLAFKRNGAGKPHFARTDYVCRGYCSGTVYGRHYGRYEQRRDAFLAWKARRRQLGYQSQCSHG